LPPRTRSAAGSHHLQCADASAGGGRGRCNALPGDSFLVGNEVEGTNCAEKVRGLVCKLRERADHADTEHREDPEGQENWRDGLAGSQTKVTEACG